MADLSQWDDRKEIFRKNDLDELKIYGIIICSAVRK